MKAIFVMPSGIEFIKEVYSLTQDFRIALPKNIKTRLDVDFENETSLLERNSVNLVFKFNRTKNRYEYDYLI